MKGRVPERTEAKNFKEADVKTKIIEMIRQVCALEEKRMTLKTKLEDLSLDSLSFIELLVLLEETFGIEFSEEELNIRAWRSVGDIVKSVEAKHEEKSFARNPDIR